MNLLVTCDENYLAPLRVMLYSAFAQSPDTVFDVYLMHSSIPDEKTESLRRFVESRAPACMRCACLKMRFRMRRR